MHAPRPVLRGNTKLMPVEVPLYNETLNGKKRNAFSDEINFNGKHWQMYVSICAIVYMTYIVKRELDRGSEICLPVCCIIIMMLLSTNFHDSFILEFHLIFDEFVTVCRDTFEEIKMITSTRNSQTPIKNNMRKRREKNLLPNKNNENSGKYVMFAVCYVIAMRYSAHSKPC